MRVRIYTFVFTCHRVILSLNKFGMISHQWSCDIVEDHSDENDKDDESEGNTNTMRAECVWLARIARLPPHFIAPATSSVTRLPRSTTPPATSRSGSVENALHKVFDCSTRHNLLVQGVNGRWRLHRRHASSQRNHHEKAADPAASPRPVTHWSQLP